MDNKLSELSKPVAWKLHHRDRYYFEENADVVAIAESMGQAKGDAVYSQEYVSALLAELESKTDFSDKAIERISGLEKACDKYLRQTKKAERELLAAKERLAELEKRLATPVRLPRTLWYEHDDLAHEIPVLEKKKVVAEICAAGFTVEGDDA